MPFPLPPVTEAESGLRADAWLARRYPAFPMAALRQLIASGALLRSGHPCPKGERVRPGTAYTLLREPAAPPTLAPNPDLPLALLHEDDTLLAVDKPAGLDCQPNTPGETDTLANALLARFPDLAGIGDGPLTCGILHRIDRDTSGLVLVARTQAAYTALRAQFAAHTVEKHYLALAQGTLSAPGHLENLLAHNPRCPGRMIDATRWHDAKRPMRAVTDYRPLRALKLHGTPFTLLDVTIYTGVTHQIRAQLSLAGHPLLGDQRYGGLQLPNFPRHFLHAASASFTHPTTGAPLTLSAPLPADLTAFLR